MNVIVNEQRPFQAVLQEMRLHRTGNPATDLLLHVLLKLLTDLFDGLDTLIEKIRSGRITLPRAAPPRTEAKTRAAPPPRRRTRRRNTHRWPTAPRPEPADHPGPPEQPPRTRHEPPGPARPPARRRGASPQHRSAPPPGRPRQARARVSKARSPPQRKKARPEPTPRHVPIVAITK